MATEIELKLSLHPDAPRQVGRLAFVRLYAQGHGIRTHLITTYYDTPDRRLSALGIALRIRRAGKRWIQTVKTTGVTRVGLHSRGEWEWVISKQILNLDLCAEQPEIADVFNDPTLRVALQPLFTTKFWRTTWALVLPDGGHIELAADYGVVSTAERSTPIYELELELKEGSPQHIYEIASALVKVLPVRLENTSKAARGYALLEPSASPVSCKAKMIGLRREEATEEAFQAIIQHCLDHLHANSTVVDYGEDPEGIHQMRVATRRLRSCLNLFRPLIPRTTCEGIAAEIRWLTNELGHARDWDVFINETLNPLARYFPNHVELNALLATAMAARAQAYQIAQAAVRSPRYTQLLLEVSLWYTRRDWRDLLTTKQLRDLEHPVEWFAATLLTRRHTRVQKLGQDFHQLSSEGRHRLRILCKRLRYAGEFFVDLYHGSEIRSYLQTVAKLQDILGVLNDASVARQLLTELNPSPGDLAAHLVSGWKAAMTEQHITQFDIAWKTFRDQPHFWE